MNYIIFDFETTSLNPYGGEVITGHFIKCNNLLEKLDELSVFFKPDVSENLWNLDAQDIHKISYKEASSFPISEIGLNQIIDFCKSDDDTCLICFANYSNQFGSYYFDIAFFQSLLNKHDRYYEFFSLFKYELSVHTLYKEMQKKELIDKRIKLGLKDVCEYFNVKLAKHHQANADTQATYECLYKMNNILEKNKLKLNFFFKKTYDIKKQLDICVKEIN